MFQNKIISQTENSLLKCFYIFNSETRTRDLHIVYYTNFITTSSTPFKSKFSVLRQSNLLQNSTIVSPTPYYRSIFLQYKHSKGRETL